MATVNNAGGTILSTGASSVVNLNGATITDGTLTTTSGGTMQNTGSATLNGVAISGGSTVTLVNNTVTNLQGIITNDGTLALNSGGNFTDVILLSPVTLQGTGTLAMSDNLNNRIYAGNGIDTLTNAAGHTIQGAGQIGVGFMGLVNDGTILANVTNALNIDTSASGFTNNGTLQTASGSTLGVTSSTGFMTNTGNVIVNNGGVMTLTPGTTFIQSGGSANTQVAGMLTAALVTIQGGTLSGGGTINGNVSMAGTIIAGTPGNPLTFNITGNYEQTGAGVYNELISNTANGLLNVGGSATLDPGASLNISLLGGFNPSNGTNFIIMDYGSESGTFLISDPLFNGGTQQWVISSYAGGDGDDIVLTAEAAGTVPAPEPDTMLLLGTGLLALVGYARNRKGAAGR